MSNLSSVAWLISLRKRAKNAYFAQLDELSELSLFERSCISYRRVGGRIGARSINIYVGYMLANFGTGSMKYKPIDNTKTTQYQGRLQYQLYCIVCFDNGESSRIILLSFTFVVVSLELNAIFKLCLIDIVFFILLRSVIFFIVCERKNNLSVTL